MNKEKVLEKVCSNPGISDVEGHESFYSNSQTIMNHATIRLIRDPHRSLREELRDGLTKGWKTLNLFNLHNRVTLSLEIRIRFVTRN